MKHWNASRPAGLIADWAGYSSSPDLNSAAWGLFYLPSFFLAWAMVHFLRELVFDLFFFPNEEPSLISHVFLPVLILVDYTENVQASPWESKEILNPSDQCSCHLPGVVVAPIRSAEILSTHAHTPDKLCKILVFSPYPQETHRTLLAFLQIFTVWGRSFLHPTSAIVAVSLCYTLELSD